MYHNKLDMSDVYSSRRGIPIIYLKCYTTNFIILRAHIITDTEKSERKLFVVFWHPRKQISSIELSGSVKLRDLSAQDHASI